MRLEQTFLWAPKEYWEFTEEQLRDLIGDGGCGPGGVGDYLVPDKLYGSIDVKPACMIHDYMYAVGEDEHDKDYADEVFFNNMLQLIMWETASWYGDKEKQARVREECFRQAKTYFNFVKWFGGPSFWAGKEKPKEEV